MTQGEGTPADVLAGNARWCVVEGDAAEVLRALPDGCAHVTYCDPSYGLASITTADVVACLTAWLAGKPYVHASPGFMGHAWDSFVPGPEAFREVFRVLRPGAYCVAFSSTRTVDLLGIAVRLAGFEMRPGWAWVTGQAFPKSLDVSKAIDGAAGAEREVVGDNPNARPNRAGVRSSSLAQTQTAGGPLTAPATAAAAQWEGYGTDLKPSYEPLIVARKPLAGTVAENVQRHGCGALNIDAGRIASGGASPSVARRESAARSGNAPVARGVSPSGWGVRGDAALYIAPRPSEQLGRFPAALALVHSEGCELVGTTRVRGQQAILRNESAEMGYSGGTTRKPGQLGHADADGMETVDEWVCVEGCAVAELARQSGERTSGSGVKGKRSQVSTYGMPSQDLVTNYDGDTGTAARFFFQAKAAASDRLAFVTCAPGCIAHETVIGAREGRAAATCPTCGGAREKYEHATVKPLDLSRYHARLLSLPAHVDPVALVPFCGSGPEARALLEMGFRVIAVDLDPRHCAMTRHRLAQPLDAPQAKPARKAPRPTAAAPVAPAAPPPVASTTPLVAVPSRPRGRAENVAQLSLFGGGAK